MKLRDETLSKKSAMNNHIFKHGLQAATQTNGYEKYRNFLSKELSKKINFLHIPYIKWYCLLAKDFFLIQEMFNNIMLSLFYCLFYCIIHTWNTKDQVKYAFTIALSHHCRHSSHQATYCRAPHWLERFFAKAEL